jgi:hypothetical protein
MPGQKRDELLTEKERLRLINRQDADDKKIRAANDIRAKKKLSSWLKNIPDVLLILDKLPEDYIREVLVDNDIFKLFKLTEKVIHIKDFTPIDGRLVDESWIGHNGEVGDLDIWRASKLQSHIKKLIEFNGHRNPLIDMEIFEQKEKHSDLYNLTEEERRGAARVRRAIESMIFRHAHPGAEPYPDKDIMWANARRAAGQEKPK